MKKIVIALTAMAAFTGSAVAADMAPRAYTKAPAPVAAVANWTGCYVGGGGGYGMWNQDNTGYLDTVRARRRSDAGSEHGAGNCRAAAATSALSRRGCDYQFALGAWNMVVGAFGDYDFASDEGPTRPAEFRPVRPGEVELEVGGRRPYRLAGDPATC